MQCFLKVALHRLGAVLPEKTGAVGYAHRF